MPNYMNLPGCFCWTRFGSEAGQGIEHILRRKEEERVANQGVFLWGIGNSVGAAIGELVRRCGSPEVLFSPIKSPAKPMDVVPDSVVAWTKAETIDGHEFLLPAHSMVTSRLSISSPKSAHYALVCFSESPLMAGGSSLRFSFGALRNILSGKPVGASQVTAVVTATVGGADGGAVYEAPLRANLAPPFFIRLREPRPIPSLAGSKQDWASAVQSAWQRKVNCA